MTLKVTQQLQSLIPNKDNPKQVNPIVYIQILYESQRNTVLEVIDLINGIGYQVPGIELVKRPIGLNQNEIRYFRASDKIYAETLQGILKTMNIKSTLKLMTGYASTTKEGTIEIWLK